MACADSEEQGALVEGSVLEMPYRLVEWRPDHAPGGEAHRAELLLELGEAGGRRPQRAAYARGVGGHTPPGGGSAGTGAAGGEAMNLIETLLATVVVSMSAAASLQLWGLAAVATAKHDRLQDLMDQVDAELMAVDLRLRQEARAVAIPQDCADAAQQLIHLALAMPAGWRRASAGGAGRGGPSAGGGDGGCRGAGSTPPAAVQPGRPESVRRGGGGRSGARRWSGRRGRWRGVSGGSRHRSWW
jgi:hypothetical protein